MVCPRAFALIAGPLTLGLALAPFSPASAAKTAAKPAAKKTAAKPAAKKPAAGAAKRPPVLGTKPLRGDQAEIGQTYTLGKENPMNVTVLSLRYSVERVRIGQNHYVPNADSKLLIINFKCQNPLGREQNLRFDTVHFTAVDAKDVNHENPQELGDPATGDSVEVSLKPGQVKNVFTYIVVPADLQIPKLVAKSNDNLVLRYDLHGKIKGLDALFADPKDSSGAAAVGQVPAQLNAPFQIGWTSEGPTYDLVVEKVAFVDGPLGEVRADEGKRLLVMTGKVTNQNEGKALFRFDSLRPVVLTQDDERIPAPQALLAATSNREIEHDLEKGGSARFRMYFQVPKDAKLKSLLVRQTDEARTYVIDVSTVQ